MAKLETDTFHIAGNIIRMLSPSAANGGQMSIAECRTRPGAGSPVNRHPLDDESFYVLSGQFAFMVDGGTKTLGPGGFVQVPNGGAHQFTNTGGGDATMLIICRSGTVHDAFFPAAGEPLPPGTSEFSPHLAPPDFAAIAAAAHRCGIEFLGPEPRR